MKGLMDAMAKADGHDSDTTSLPANTMDADNAEGGPAGMPSEEQISVAGDVMSAMQNGDTDGFAEALASFVALAQP